ncbi:MAG: hypothetical protein Q7R91_03065 [bacterium]|nr:hypothetical protein [bacterium]
MIKSKVKSFDWKTFSMKAKKLLEFASRSTIAPVNAGRWEEIVFHILKNMGQKYKGGDPKWEVGSHAPGADLWIDLFAISAKAGGIQNSTLSISSYRLTQFKNLDAMIEFIDGDGKNFDIYLYCARIDNADGSRTYKVFVVSADIFIAKKLKWTKQISHGNKISGWHGLSNNGVEVNIQKNMSNQLWIKIPLALCLQISEVNISQKFLGSSLSEVI